MCASVPRMMPRIFVQNNWLPGLPPSALLAPATCLINLWLRVPTSTWGLNLIRTRKRSSAQAPWWYLKFPYCPGRISLQSPLRVIGPTKTHASCCLGRSCTLTPSTKLGFQGVLAGTDVRRGIGTSLEGSRRVK